MNNASRLRIPDWLAPAFLILLALVFLLAPFPFADKLNGVCYGI